MLSYQHIYHAGNMADLHKHLWLLCVLEYLGRKDKPYCWIDTHAGRGVYDLGAPEAEKLGEYKDGIARVYESLQASEHPLLKLYGACIKKENRGALRYYPGSAILAAQMLRGNDRLFAFDMHPKEFEFLDTALRPYKNAKAQKQNGYAGLKSLCPPPIRRGGVLIDPSYEIKSEYDDVAGALNLALKKWPQGVYMVWYPILAAARHEAMCEALTETARENTLEFTRSEWMFDGVEKGMLGSGMFILNTPYSCEDVMADVKATLTR